MKTNCLLARRLWLWGISFVSNISSVKTVHYSHTCTLLVLECMYKCHLFFSTFNFVCVCSYRCVYLCILGCRSEDNSCYLFFFHHVRPGDWIQVIRPNWQQVPLPTNTVLRPTKCIFRCYITCRAGEMAQSKNAYCSCIGPEFYSPCPCWGDS